VTTELVAGRQRPPLTKRMRPRYWMAIDFVAGALAGPLGVLAAVHDVVTLPSRLLLGAVIVFPVGLRRRQPLLAFGALVVPAVLTTATGPAAPAFIFFAAAYVLYT
jgi:hypothetical protein